MLSNPLFGLTLTGLVFMFSGTLAKKTKSTLLNPLLVSSILVIVLLLIFKIPYADYNQGGKYLTWLITPATVSLAIPLYQNLDTLKKNFKLVLIGIITAISFHFVSLMLIAWILNMDLNVIASLIPKSITTAFAKDVSTQLGGIEIITISVVIVTGIFGAALSDFLNKTFKISDDIAVGMALGSSAHAIGTSKAVENNDIQATFSSLALILTGIVTVIIAPLLMIITKFIF